jgi:hypothetical protein
MQRNATHATKRNILRADAPDFGGVFVFAWTVMPFSFYSDVDLPRAIRDQRRLNGVDVLTAHEDSAITLEDDEVLERTTNLVRVPFTQDIHFKVLAEDWQRQRRPFAGLIFLATNPAAAFRGFGFDRGT